MSNTQPGWYADPHDKSRLRWWDGSEWTVHVSRDGVVSSASLAPPPPAAVRRIPLWGWLLTGALGLILLVALPRVVSAIALVLLVAGIIAWRRGVPRWIPVTSQKVVAGVTVGSAALLLVSAAIGAAAPGPAPLNPASKPVPFVAEAEPSPTSNRSVREETVTEAIAFEQTTVEDPNLTRGQTQITTAGQNGERTLTYRVILVGGVEESRELISDLVTREPTAQVTALGTYDPPPPPPAPEAASCDPNYADACVPVASDVDCAWGSGNGPAYFDGVARVVGTDVYDLDRDGDGLACEQ